MNKIHYTIISSNEDDYSIVKTCLEKPHTQLSKLTITGLTTLCSIVVLDKNDYIDINNIRFQVKEEYTNLNSTSLVEILSNLIDNHPSKLSISVFSDNTNRLEFEHDNEEEFTITDASYGMKQITGLYGSELPLKSDDRGRIMVKSVGFYLSTPILYLLSNLGSSCFQNKDKTYFNQSTAMRIHNSFSPNIPIICNNVEFSAIVVSNSLSDLWFRLVDANLHPIKILSPIFITAVAEGINININETVKE
jgi:hypothetical protein